MSGLGVILAAAKTFSAAAPHGTWGAQMAIILVSSAKSARPVIWAGLPAGTAICSVLDAKSTGRGRAPPASVTVFMVAGLAAAKTSAGAPWLIWVASVELEPKLKVDRAARTSPGSPVPIWVKASVNDAAANTVIGGAGADSSRRPRPAQSAYQHIPRPAAPWR